MDVVPHVLLAVADDLGWNDVSFHGSEISTPNLDRLALGNHSAHLVNYYGQSICTPARSSMLTGRYASHTGMQHSYWVQGQAGGLPLKFKTLADRFAEVGYARHAVGKWHLGFESWSYTPLGRGFESYYGYLGGGEDYLSHKTGGFVDLTANRTAVLTAGGVYSTVLFADQAIARINDHAALGDRRPLFLYLAFQAVHSPLQAPQEWIDRYSWLTDPNRRVMAAMTSCMDEQFGRVVDALEGAGMWSQTVLAFVADNGGPPYVANSNWPMRGGKWTMWEGGTHLTGFIHAPSHLPEAPRRFEGLMHQADLLPTLLGASGVVAVNDSVTPPMDGLNMWPALLNPADVHGPRRSVLLNVDPTNQGGELHDPGGWSGYAGIRVGEFKLVLGDPGVPNAWCWPNQNRSKSRSDSSSSSSTAVEMVSEERVMASPAAASPSSPPPSSVQQIIERHITSTLDPRYSVRIEAAEAEKLRGHTMAVPAHAPPPPWVHSSMHVVTDLALADCPEAARVRARDGASCTLVPSTCLPGNDLAHFVLQGPAQECCAACVANSSCTAWTFNTADEPSQCWLKTRPASIPEASDQCTSGLVDGRPPAPPPPTPPGSCAATDYSHCTCAYNGTVPNNRVGALLFNLREDPRETTNLAADPNHAGTLAELRAALQIFIDSAVTPLNELPAQREVDPAANPSTSGREYWAPWM